MTLLEQYHAAYSAYNALDYAVQQQTRRRKPVSAEMLAQREAAYATYQAALAEMNRIVAGRK